MKPEEQRIAIAEACGKCLHTETKKWEYEDGNDYDWGYSCIKCKADPFSEKDRLPNYPQDLNAMHEAEKSLKGDDIHTYFDKLDDVILNLYGYQGADWSRIATAAQRAEAFLRTLGKWKEE